jgi:DoxX-like family
MKKNKIIYWIATGIISFVMVFSIYKMFTVEYNRFDLPNYFRIELTVFKILGLIVLLTPQFPVRIKEWAYAGFGITLISACVAHYYTGDSLLRSLDPIIFLVILAVSNVFLYKMKTVK